MKESYIAQATFNSGDHTPVGDIKYGAKENQRLKYDFLPDSGAAPYIAGESGAGDSSGGFDGSGAGDYGGGEMQDVGGYDSGSFYASKHPKGLQSSSHKVESQEGRQFSLSNRGKSHETGSTEATEPTGITFALSDRGRPPKSKTEQEDTMKESGESGESVNDSKSTKSVESDYVYLVKYFPGGKHVYKFDESGSILGTSDVSLNNRKDIKRAVCGHWYFFTFGSVLNEKKAKSLSERLATLKSNLSFASHLRNKVF
jgi:hypothetical protein